MILHDYTGSEYGFIDAIFGRDDDTPYLKTFAITNVSLSEETRRFYDETAPEGLEFNNLDSLFGHTIRTGEVVIANNPATDPWSGGLPIGQPAMHCYLGVPIKESSGLIAMYGMANRKEGYDDVVEDLKAITAIVTSMIEFVRNLSIIERMANRDSLTGTYNRFYISKYINELIEETDKSGREKFCIMMVDLDKFKHVNHYYGHEYGDRVIKEFASRIGSSIKQGDIFVRIGGDEFVVFLKNVDDSLCVKDVVERILSASKKAYLFNEKRIECSASIGVSCYPCLGVTFDELLRHADLVLYEEKAHHKGYCFFTLELQTQCWGRQNTEKQIAEAFKNKEFFWYFSLLWIAVRG
jgi:methyl-accepting chemotaxis protein